MGKSLTLGLLLFIAHLSASADARIPKKAYLYAPILVQEQLLIWGSAPQPFTLAGQVEQESCVSVGHPRCWDPRAELKTPREYGFGLGQITIAYNSDGSERFNKFQELTKNPLLKNWTWGNRFDAKYQLRAIVLSDYQLWNRFRFTENESPVNTWGFVLSAYNGGFGSILQDKRFCGNQANCNPGLWFNNVERYSLKSKVPQKSYGGQSWYSINRGYVRDIIQIRREKYKSFWEGK